MLRMAVYMLLGRYMILGFPNEGFRDLWASACFVLSSSITLMELMIRHFRFVIETCSFGHAGFW